MSDLLVAFRWEKKSIFFLASQVVRLGLIAKDFAKVQLVECGQRSRRFIREIVEFLDATVWSRWRFGRRDLDTELRKE